MTSRYIHQTLLSGEAVPLGVIVSGGDYGRGATVAFLRELEEGIDLIGIQGKVSGFTLS